LQENGQDTNMVRRIAAVIVHYGDSRRIVRAVLSYRELGIFSDIVVVANDMSQRPHDLPIDWCKWLMPSRNLGYGGACQFGAMACSANIYAFFNAHIQIDRASVDRCASAFDLEDVGIAAPSIFHPGNGDLETTWRYAQCIRTYSRILHLPIHVPSSPTEAAIRANLATLIDVDWATGGTMFCRDDVIDNIGWDGSYFLTYEDVDISIRAKKCGWRIVTVPAAMAHHTGESTRSSTASAYYGMRNTLWFCRKFSTRRCQILLTVYLILRLLRIAAADVLKRRRQPNAPPAARGILDGWLLWPVSTDALSGEPIWPSKI
jgi:N-acetylglucosaminyl-diphospho-decaprenol L-rhamnosyltransferase